MTDLLIRLRYAHRKRKEKGIVRRYLTHYSGYSASHVDHLIAQYQRRGKITRAKRTQPTFGRVYTHDDIKLRAAFADAYEHQNGKALKTAMGEMYHV